MFSIALRSYFRKFHRTSAASLSNSVNIHFNSSIQMLHMYAIILSNLDVSFKWSHNTGLFCRHNASFVILIGWSRFFRSSIRYILIFGWMLDTRLVVIVMFAQSLVLSPRHVWCRPIPRCAPARSKSIQMLDVFCKPEYSEAPERRWRIWYYQSGLFQQSSQRSFRLPRCIFETWGPFIFISSGMGSSDVRRRAGIDRIDSKLN